MAKPSPAKKQVYTSNDADEVLGRTHLTGYEGWPPPKNVYEHLSVFADFIDSKLVNGTMLDVGCGDGSIARIIALKNPKKKIIAIDLEAHPQWKMKPPKNLEFRTADIYKLPFKPGSFDTVILKDVLHHLPDPEVMLPQIAKLAKKQILVIEANRYNPISYIRMVKIAGHEHFSRKKLKRVVGGPVEIFTYETHVWPDGLKTPGRVIDVIFGLPFMKRVRNYNLALIKAK